MGMAGSFPRAIPRKGLEVREALGWEGRARLGSEGAQQAPGSYRKATADPHGRCFHWEHAVGPGRDCSTCVSVVCSGRCEKWRSLRKASWR